MGLTSIFKGEFANRLRNDKHFLEWFRESDISEKMLRNSRYTSETLREFVKSVEIKDVKPFSGWKRRLQLDSLKIASDFTSELEKEGIFPFIWAGTLIGAVRHQGFIPWDDDIDYEIMHSDYERMIKYCQEHHHVIYPNGKTEKEDFEQIDNLCAEHKGEKVLIVGDKYSKLTIADSHVKRITIDFWPLEYIKEDTDFQTYMEYKKRIRKTGEALPREKRVDFFHQQEKLNPYVSDTPTSKLFGGVDMISIVSEKVDKFLLADYVFPLQKMKFEDKFLWAPANPDMFLKHHRKFDYMSYPTDFATFRLPSHEDIYDSWFREHGIKAELVYSTDEELKAMLPLYNELRDRNVFALFINKNTDDVWGMSPDKYEVRWTTYSDFESQYAVTMGDPQLLKRYKKKKLLFQGNVENTVEQILS